VLAFCLPAIPTIHAYTKKTTAVLRRNNESLIEKAASEFFLMRKNRQDEARCECWA
jgi:hypothetical protein